MSNVFATTDMTIHYTCNIGNFETMYKLLNEERKYVTVIYM